MNNPDESLDFIKVFNELLDPASKFDGLAGQVGPRKSNEQFPWRTAENLVAEIHPRADFSFDFNEPGSGQGLCVRVYGEDSGLKGVKGTAFQIAMGPSELMRLCVEMAKEDDWFRIELSLLLKKITLNEELKLLRAERDGEET